MAAHRAQAAQALAAKPGRGLQDCSSGPMRTRLNWVPHCASAPVSCAVCTRPCASVPRSVAVCRALRACRRNFEIAPGCPAAGHCIRDCANRSVCARASGQLFDTKARVLVVDKVAGDTWRVHRSTSSCICLTPAARAASRGIATITRHTAAGLHELHPMTWVMLCVNRLCGYGFLRNLGPVQAPDCQQLLTVVRQGLAWRTTPSSHH